ncbi:MAG: tripartite tricarboxylate transporter substrate binding protein, partial [Nocardioidaceae bacterium]
MHSKLASVGACLAAAVALAACGGTGGAGTAESYPEEPLEWTVAFGPGGGNDIMSRQIVDILEKEKLYPDDITVE